MLAEPKVLVVTVIRNSDWHAEIESLSSELCANLEREHQVKLASKVPVPLEAAVSLNYDGELVVVAIGEAEKLALAAEPLQPLCGRVLPICVAFDRGAAQLTLSNAGIDEVSMLVRTAIDALGGIMSDSGHGATIIDLDRERRPGSNRAAAEKDVQLPAIETTSQYIAGSISTALEWAEAAAGTLADLLADSDRDEGGNVFGPGWHALLASITRLATIRDVPFEKAEERYRVVRSMLAHPAAAQTPLVRLAQLLGLSDVAIKLLIVVAAPDLDLRFERLYGGLNDDLGRRHATLGLACAIIAANSEKCSPKSVRAAIAAHDRLRALRLIEGAGQTMAAADEPLRVDPHVLDWLITGRTELLLQSPALAGLIEEPEGDAVRLLGKERVQRITAAVQPRAWRHGDPDQFEGVVLTGSDPGWRVAEACAVAGRALLLRPPAAGTHPDSIARTAAEAVRAGGLLGARLVVDLASPQAHAENFWNSLSPLLRHCQVHPFLLTDHPAALLEQDKTRLAVAALPPVAASDRADAIAALLRSENVGDVSEMAVTLADRFNVPLDRLPGLIPLARVEAGKAQRAAPGLAEWNAAFRNLAGADLPALAHRIPPQPVASDCDPLDRVVLPEAQRAQLAAVLQHVRVGTKVMRDWDFGRQFAASGVSALFAGESGTGKTTAAHAIASALDTDLYIIDLAKVVSKYIGETEKNLDLAFTEAERAGAVLLFDEADALFGKRSKVSDAHDRYANIEVAYLLQRIELFSGLAILTTNHPRNVDQAFGRRMRFTVEFPFPEAADRLKIWEQALPAGSPHRSAEVDFLGAARRLELNGGSIRQVLLHALMAAADTLEGLVTPQHLRDAASTELRRLAKFDRIDLVQTLFGPSSEARAA